MAKVMTLKNTGYRYQVCSGLLKTDIGMRRKVTNFIKTQQNYMEPNQVTDMANERFESVWDAIEDTPEEALNMRLRSELMIQITRRVKEWNVTQKEAAQRLGITQPRLNDLLNGRINKFGLDALVNLTGPAHFHVELTLEDKEAAVA